MAVLAATGLISISMAQDVMTVKMKDGTVHEFKVDDVSEVTFNSSGINLDYPVAEAIDLGLPSGTKWASWNIGASKPEEYGGHFAWGETEEKDYYDWSTYIHCDGSESTCHHIGDDIAGTEYDVAHVKWGGSWRMPTLNQVKELVNNCTKTWTTQNGVNGILVTGSNGRTIFLPAAGDRWGDDLRSGGHYWSSSLNQYNEYSAYLLAFSSYNWHWSNYSYRCYGLSVRAVCP